MNQGPDGELLPGDPPFGLRSAAPSLLPSASDTRRFFPVPLLLKGRGVAAKMPRLLPSPLLMIYTLYSCYTCRSFPPTLRKLFHLRGSETLTPCCGLATCLIRKEPQRPRRAAPASRQAMGHTPWRSAPAGAEPLTGGTPTSPDTPGGARSPSQCLQEPSKCVSSDRGQRPPGHKAPGARAPPAQESSILEPRGP